MNCRFLVGPSEKLFLLISAPKSPEEDLGRLQITKLFSLETKRVEKNLLLKTSVPSEVNILHINQSTVGTTCKTK